MVDHDTLRRQAITVLEVHLYIKTAKWNMIGEVSSGINGGGGITDVWVFCYHSIYNFSNLYQNVKCQPKRNQIPKTQSHTFFPLWKNTAPRMCSPGKEAVPRHSQSLRMWSLKLHNCTFPAVSATSSLSPGKSHSSAVTPTLLETTLKWDSCSNDHLLCITTTKYTLLIENGNVLPKKRNQLYRIWSPPPL